MQKMQLSKLMQHANRMGRRTPVKATHVMARQVYDSINRAVFGGALQRPRIIIHPYRDMWGECHGARRRRGYGNTFTKAIRINRYWPNMKKLIAVMAHEMIHQYEWERLGTMSHGTTFFAWEERMLNRGIRLYVVM